MIHRIGRLAIFASLAMALTSDLMAESGLPPADSLLKRAIVSEGNQTRLREFFHKASLGGKLTIGVIGGSITQGVMCPEPAQRYHGVMLSWLEKKFPKARFSLVNVGIGATSSDYGAMRAERDLTSKLPDLVIVEYAVNDKTPDLAEPYEGLIRQILKAKTHPALILLFMMWSDGSNSQEWQAKIGERYGLPMISFRDAFWPEIQAGSIKWSQISPDAVNLNQLGHGFAGQLLCSFLESASKKSTSNVVFNGDPSSLPPPLTSDVFEHCMLYDGAGLVPSSVRGWYFDGTDKSISGWRSALPGSSIEFEIYSRGFIYLSFYCLNGPMGKAKVTIDNGEPIILDAWFSQNWGGKRQMAQIARGLNPSLYKVKIEVIQEKNPMSAGNEFRILAIGSTTH